MQFNEYQDLTSQTAVYPKDNLKLSAAYCALGLANEAGEATGKIKKWIRGDSELDVHALEKEIGDVLWYAAQLCAVFDIKLDNAASGNITKLLDRVERGVVKGNGDNR